MDTWLVFEKVPASRDAYGSHDTPIPDFGSQTVTVVEAASEDEAVRIVMGATRRMGEAYAVVPCKFLSYIPDHAAAKNKDGILTGNPQLEQTNGGSEVAPKVPAND